MSGVYCQHIDTGQEWNCDKDAYARCERCNAPICPDHTEASGLCTRCESIHKHREIEGRHDEWRRETKAEGHS